MKLAELFLNRFLYRDSIQTAETLDSVIVSADSLPADVPVVASGSAAIDVNTNTTQVNVQQIVNGVNIGYVSDPNADIVPTGLTCSSTTANVASDGSVSASVVLTWNIISTNTFDHYVIRSKQATFTYYTYFDAKTNTITLSGLVPSISYNFGISSVNKYGAQSAFSSDISQTTATSTTAPATVSGVSATPGIQYVILEWTKNTETDLSSYNIYRNTVNNSATASLIGNCMTNYFVDGGRTGGTVYYYWVKAVNTSSLVSVAFSTVAYATPRNVETTDIVSIAANKVLIDGVVYLSNWQKSGDLTKIDGGSISANTITTTQLNFTPVQGSNVIASINASVEGIRIDADNITISGSTTFSSGYDPTGRVLAVGGTYDSAASGARVRIFPDANTGIQIIDDGAADVFKCLVGGTDVGDVIIGNYGGGGGLKYDKSAGTFTFKGTLSAPSGTLGTITSGSIYSGLFSTAASGVTTQRVVLDSADNSLKFYNANNVATVNISNGGGYGILITTDTSTSNGIYMSNTADQTTRGMYIEQTNNGANNTLPCIELHHDGHSTVGALYIQSTHTSRGLYLDQSGTGQAIYLVNSGSGESILISHSGNDRGIALSYSGTGVAHQIESSNTGASYSLQIDHAANTPALQINKTGVNENLALYNHVTSAAIISGISFDLQNGGAGLEYAFDFQGSESGITAAGNSGFVSNSTGTFTAVGYVRIRVSAGVYYMPYGTLS